MFFVLTSDLGVVNRSEILMTSLSEHSPVLLSLAAFPIPIQTHWHINDGFLNNSEFKDMVKKYIIEYLETNDTTDISPIILWDALKAVLRGKLIAYGARKKERQARVTRLETEVRALEHQHKQTLSPSCRRTLEDKKRAGGVRGWTGR